MSDFLDAEYEEPDSGGVGTRRHAVWGLAVLAGVAVLVVGLMVLFGVGSSGSGRHDAIVLPPVPSTHAGDVTTAASPTGSTSPTGGTSPTTQPTTGGASTTPATIRSGNPCTGAAPCVVDGDGGAVAAVNAYRNDHHLPPVPGSVTTDAQTCALHNGGGSTCVPHYAWTSVAKQDGAAAVTKIASFAGHWLLDAKMSSFSVGWAYVGGSYQCVLLKSP